MFIKEKELNIIADLAKIYINEKEKVSYLLDLNKMESLTEILEKIDVSGLEPTTHLTDLRNVWREDIVKPCSRKIVNQMLNSAPAKEKNFYKIHKVINVK
ncbi:MAG: Asp-tRNA(Asn)/Glu-tRNA(Gln) amidotransferase subunit GatC [Endomicrobium sp.]|jgi:aspartyl/glutamyl-tRNA(Asn/Gln) amidotransferase C subunit|nr:Asp-tRNA(Asn)/Glu-tRNA(Gln) amidotransferase subunit GatC [Endomicrobium sp.]